MHDVCNCVVHGHSICPKLFVSSCGKSKGSHPRGAHNVPMCSPLKGPPSFAESNGHTNHTRFMPDSYPNHAPPHSLPPIASAQSGPTAGSPTCPTIQLQSCESSANHTLESSPESYPESYPRIIPPIQTSRPDYGKKYTPIYIYS